MHSGETRSLCAFKKVSTDTQMVSVFRLCCSQKRPGFADGLHWISCQGQPQGPHQPLHRSSPAAEDSGFFFLLAGQRIASHPPGSKRPKFLDTTRAVSKVSCLPEGVRGEGDFA